MKSNFFITCVAIIAGLLLAESILWIFFPITETEKINVFNTNIPGLKKHIIYDENSFGFRSLSMRTEQKPSNTIRIICLGHSTTMQHTQSTEDIWPAILEKKLQDRFGSKGIRIEVAAWGKGGEGVQQNLSWAQKNILNYQPDLVVLLEGVNDITWNVIFSKEAKRKKVNKENGHKKIIIPSSWHVFLLRFSQIFKRLMILKHNVEIYGLMEKGKALDWHSENLPRLRKEYRDLSYVENPQFDPRLLPDFSDNLASLVIFLKKANVSVVVLGQPVIWKARMDAQEINALWFPVQSVNGEVRPSTAWLENEMSAYNDVQKEISNTLNVPYIDLDQKIPKNLRYFFDDCHFTDLGNVEVANEIFPVMSGQVENILKNMSNQQTAVQ